MVVCVFNENTFNTFQAFYVCAHGKCADVSF